MQREVCVTIGDEKYTEEKGAKKKKHRTRAKSRRNTHAALSAATAALVVYGERSSATRHLLAVS